MDEANGLTLGFADINDVFTVRGGSCLARTDHEEVSSLELLNVAGDTDPSVHEDHDVLAHALDIGEHVRRQDDGRAVLGDGTHELFQ